MPRPDRGHAPAGGGRAFVVAIETSTRRASVAARIGDRTSETLLESERAHASDLLPALDRLVRGEGADPADLEAVCVGTGPGSYTGLRVGIATALGLARASGAVALGVPSGETLCLSECADGGSMVLLLDARSGEIYYAKYRRSGDEVDVIDPPRVVKPGEVGALVAGDLPIFGDESVATAAGLDESARSRLRTDVAPRASVLLDLGGRRIARGIATKLGELEPLYLRGFVVSRRR
jgi:tRNA threonylcarbamoyladenosine biosynthesis protein TsaB